MHQLAAMKPGFSIVLLLMFLPAVFNGQVASSFTQDANGRPFYLRGSYKTEGSPYLSDKYQLADIYASNGHVYHDIMVKIDLAFNRVQYITSDSVEMIASLPVKKIVFTNYENDNGVKGDNTFIGYPAALNEAGASVYQVLEAGSVNLVKNFKIRYQDDRKYGDAAPTRTFSQTDALYALFPPDRIVKIEKGKEAVMALFPEKKTELARFIDSSHTRCRTEEELRRVFRFCNALK